MGLLQDNEPQSYGGLLDEPGNRSGSGLMRYLSDADLLSLAGFMKPTRGGNFGEALANGLAGAVEGRESQLKRQHMGLDTLAKMRKEQEEYGLNPVIDNQGNAWVMSKSGIPKKITDFVPSDKISTINAGGNHYVIGRNGAPIVTYGSTQTPDNIASTGVNVSPNGTATAVPGFAPAKANTAQQVAEGEGRGKVPFAQASADIGVDADARKKEAQDRIERNAKLQATLDSIQKTQSILNAPYTVNDQKLTAEEMLAKAADTYPERARDVTMNAFGRQSYQDQLNTTLKRVSDELLLSVPRFEGPQSDRDVQTYRSLAGNLGDPLIPAEKRLQTLKTMQDLLNVNHQTSSKLISQGQGLYGRNGNTTYNFGSLDEAMQLLNSPEVTDEQKAGIRKAISTKLGIPSSEAPAQPSAAPFRPVGTQDGQRRSVTGPNGEQATAVLINGKWVIEQ